MIKSLSADVDEARNYFDLFPSSYKLVFAAVLATFSAILQSAGGFLPGIGFLISPFAAMPILIVAVYTGRYGLLSYVLTAFLLLLLQPAELFIFPFTTGLLGLVIGFGLRIFKSRIIIALAGALALTAGISIPLYVLGFPILGPMVTSVPRAGNLCFIFLFCTLYSSIWLLISLIILGKINRIRKSGV